MIPGWISAWRRISDPTQRDQLFLVGSRFHFRTVWLAESEDSALGLS